MPPGSELDALAVALGERVRRDEPLAHYTSMRIGGPADLLLVCESVEEILRAISLAERYGVEWRLLGGGCNVLVSDAGVSGLVIINRAARTRLDPVNGTAWAEAGALMSTLARESVELGLAGLEWAAGLPGSVGGAIVGNAGAFNGDVAAVLHSATVLSPDGEVVERPAGWFQFEYRGSRIKKEGGRKYAVLAACFALRQGDPEHLRARVEEILEWRRTRHPSGATMGSTFKNPPDSHAGYLIEKAGLRGHCIGGAKISELHGNFFMNTGGATARDVLALIEYARSEVRARFGVELELEIEVIGRGEWR
ncbi:MAG: UDP-N-acetylmuramate dehydrogenase [Anaerolineae bacterium]|nr:UDP-N-acetylmuramate dehydrogenase [Anaerolineae bacterium]